MYIVKIYKMDENMRVEDEKNILLENDDMESIIKKVTGEPIIKEVERETLFSPYIEKLIKPSKYPAYHYGFNTREG